MFRPFIAAALGAALVTAPASAGETDKNTVSVSYNDLDLSTQEGQDKLEARFASAARKVCEADAQQTGTRIASNQVRRCLAEAKKSTKAAMARIMSEEQLGG